MYKYQEFGLVNTKAMFIDAYQEGYAVPAFNFVALEQLMAIVGAASECSSPIIIQCSANVRRYIGKRFVQRMVQAAVETVRDLESNIQIALNLDHGMNYEECKDCIDWGFSSLMIDGSALPFEENIALTKKVVEYAHKRGVTVEGELGVLSGVEEIGEEEEGGNRVLRYTDPEQTREFVNKTGVDSLAISIGTSHGVVKTQLLPDGTVPELRFDILQKVHTELPGFPIVLHGASNITQKHIDMINSNGGNLTEARGIDEKQVEKAAQMNVCKINTASDGWIAFTACTRKSLAEKPDMLDPRGFLKPSIAEMKSVYIHKIKDVFHSDNRKPKGE